MRTISADVKRVIRFWAKSVLRNEKVDTLFTHEMLFYEDNMPYWIPIQKTLRPFFEEELRKNENVVIYITVIGAERSHIVFTVNEFRKN